MAPLRSAEHQLAVRHLRRRDPVLRRVIDQVGGFDLQPRRQRFAMLVYSIISQQVSTAAARSIRERLKQQLAPRKVSALSLSALSDAEIRAAGVSPQKLRYMRDLTQKVLDGTVRLRQHTRMTDDEVIADLVQVLGIGEWTAHMFLIFSLGRLDVLPYGDLGVRSAIKNLFELKDLPDRAACERIAEPWRPYASVASWYCWRSLDL